MIIVNIKGGLGNQMFQYAFGRAFSIKKSVEMKLDISGYPQQSLREYKLNKFKIDEKIATDDEIARLKYPFGIFSKAGRFFKQRILRNFHINHEPYLLRFKDNHYFDGYFQTEKYFLDIRDIILSDFTLADELCPEAKKIEHLIKEATVPVSIHVRRGDYVSNNDVARAHGGCSPSYYQKAIEEISRMYPGANFFVFSDDIDWVKQNLSFNVSAIHVSNPNIMDHEELFLMSQCKHNIVANSSFSWWGAWLNTNPKKTVIAPQKWHNNMEAYKDTVPHSWIKIQN
jgi:hypothetical protein